MAAKADIIEICKGLTSSLREGQQLSDVPEYLQIVDGLIAIVRKQRQTYDDSSDEKFLAVQLLGNLRAAKAVEVLLDNISFCPAIRTELLPFETTFPCVGALVKIGKPSVEGMLKRLDRQYDYDKMGTLVLYGVVVKGVEGREAGKALLEGELEKARTRQANLAEMLFYFGRTISDLSGMLRDQDPQVHFAAARLYARFKGWPGPVAVSIPEEREQFVADILGRIEREGGAQTGGDGREPQPQPKPAQPPAPAE